MWRLILNLGKEDEKEFQLGEGSYQIGRGRESDIHVPNRSLSRSHARLDVDREGAVLHDLGSKNKTLVDGMQVDQRRLQGGENIRCGNVRFTFLADNQETLALSATAQDRLLDVTVLGIPELLGAGAGAFEHSLRLPVGESRTLAKLRILLKVSQLLTSVPSLAELLEKVLDLVFELLDVDRAVLLMIDGESGVLVERFRRIRPGVAGGQIYSEEIARHVIGTGAPALFADVRDDPRLGPSPSIVGDSICAAMGAPLAPGDNRVLGVLYVDSVTRPDRFNDEDLEFVAAFANQAALAIENSRLQERLEQEAVRRNNLLRFFPPTTVDRMKDGEVSSFLSIIEAEVTVLFADIANYTNLSSEMEPGKVVEMLNRYFLAMSQVVFDHGGTLEKYIGDALMAIWGAPLEAPDDADRAVEAAASMQRALSEMNRSRGDFPELRIHVGVNTGPVAAGNIGSEHYLQYAVIGDATNVASRVCSVAEAGQVLLTEATYERLRDRRGTSKLPPIRVKGKDHPLQVYQLDWREQRP